MTATQLATEQQLLAAIHKEVRENTYSRRNDFPDYKQYTLTSNVYNADKDVRYLTITFEDESTANFTAYESWWYAEVICVEPDHSITHKQYRCNNKQEQRKHLEVLALLHEAEISYELKESHYLKASYELNSDNKFIATLKVMNTDDTLHSDEGFYIADHSAFNKVITDFFMQNFKDFNSEFKINFCSMAGYTHTATYELQLNQLQQFIHDCDQYAEDFQDLVISTSIELMTEETA